MNIQTGQWYVDVTNGRIYVVARVSGKYGLINIHSGIPYGGPTEDINDVFSIDRQDFTLVEKNTEL